MLDHIATRTNARSLCWPSTFLDGRIFITLLAEASTTGGGGGVFVYRQHLLWPPSVLMTFGSLLETIEDLSLRPRNPFAVTHLPPLQTS